ncbi:hypothetical protein IJ670_06145 [bacterium]|nr:hypothetical protein [bacterium]
MNINLLNSHKQQKIPMTGYNIKQDKYDDIKERSKVNTTRPAQAISFGGSAVSLGQKIGNSFVQSSKVNKLVYFVNDNEVAFTAIYSLIIAGILKPMLVLAQTGHDDKDGQMIATKNFLQAFIGSFLSFTVGGKFIKKVYDTLSNNLHLLKIKDDKLQTKDANDSGVQSIAKELIKKDHSKFRDKWQNAQNKAKEAEGFWNKTRAFFSGIQKTGYKPTQDEIVIKSQDLLKNLNDNHLQILTRNTKSAAFVKKLVKNIEEIENNTSSINTSLKGSNRSQLIDAFESFWKNSTGLPTTIGKAKLSSILLPVVVGTLFAKRNLESQAIKKNQKANMTSTLAVQKSIGKSDNFNSVIGKQQNNTPSFTGGMDFIIDSSAKFIETLATTNIFSKFTELLAKLSKKPSARMADLESFGLTGYWVYNTLRSKKIDPEQKLGLNIHTVLVTVVSSLAAFVLDTLSDIFMNKAKGAYSSKITEQTKEAIKELDKNPDITNSEIEEIIKEGTSKLYNSKDILEKIANKEVLKSDADLQKTIAGLSATYAKKLAKCKSLVIFTLVVRFLVPVLTVKSTKKIKKILVEFSKNRNNKKTQTQQAA